MLQVMAFSQRDPRWKSIKLGFSNYTIGSHGCTITSMASLLCYVYQTKTITPDYVNKELKRVGAFSGGLVIWSRVPLAFPKLSYNNGRKYSYSNTLASWYVYVKKIPVLVEVSAKSIGAIKHWVLFCGSGQEMDPWTGTFKSTGTYLPLIGMTVYDVK